MQCRIQKFYSVGKSPILFKDGGNFQIMVAQVPKNGGNFLGLEKNVEKHLQNVGYLEKNIEKHLKDVGCSVRSRNCSVWENCPTFWKRVHFKEVGICTQKSGHCFLSHAKTVLHITFDTVC